MTQQNGGSEEDHVMGNHVMTTGRSHSATLTPSPLSPVGVPDYRYLSHSAPPSHSHPHDHRTVGGSGCVSETDVRSHARKISPLIIKRRAPPPTPTASPPASDSPLTPVADALPTAADPVKGPSDVEIDNHHHDTDVGSEALSEGKALSEDLEKNAFKTAPPHHHEATTGLQHHNKYANTAVIYRPRVVVAGPLQNGGDHDNKITLNGSSSSLSSPSCLIFEENFGPPSTPKGSLVPPPRPPPTHNLQPPSDACSNTITLQGSVGGSAKYRKTFWDVLAPTYKSRTEDFKKIFHDEIATSADDNDERLLVDYSCALQREILIQGRMYITQNWVCFYANIFRWESKIKIRFKDIVAVSKEKLARIIPNAITITTRNRGKYTFASFTARDKSYLLLFRIWQNALLDQPLPGPDLWALVHESYGGELGLTSDDDDYIDPFATAATVAPTTLLYPSHHDEGGEVKSDVHPRDLRKNQANLLACVGLVDQISRVKSSPNLASAAPKSPSSFHDGDAIGGKGSVVFGPNYESVDACPLGDDNGSADHESRDPAVELGSEIVLSSTEDDEGEVEGGNACLCDSHPGKLYLNLIINKPAEEVFHLLFSNSQFFQDIQIERNTKSMVMSEWRSASLSVQNKSNLKTSPKKKRVLSYVVEISSPLGTKSAPTTEKQTLLRSNKRKSRYVVQCEVTNSGVPYSDSYYVICLYCITQTVKGRQCRLTVHCHIGYRKSVFSLVKNIIEKNCQSGLQDYFKFLGSKLISELRAKSVSKERGTKMLEDALVNQNGGSPRKSLRADRSKKWSSRLNSSSIQDGGVDRDLGQLGENSSENGGAPLDDDGGGGGIFERLTSSLGLSRHRRKRHVTTDAVESEVDHPGTGGRRVRSHPRYAAPPCSTSKSTLLLYLLVVLLCAHTTFLQYKVWYLERGISLSTAPAAIPSTGARVDDGVPYFSIDQSSFSSFASHTFRHLSWLTLPFRMVKSLLTIPWAKKEPMGGEPFSSQEIEKGITLLSQLLAQMEKSIVTLEMAYNQTHHRRESYS